MSFSAVVGVAHSAIDGLMAAGLPAALAIVVFTVLVRALISPLTYFQVRVERRRRALAPEVDRLRAEHGDDLPKLAAETMALHRANGAGLLATFVPALAQAPFFLIMYRVALAPPGGGLFGVPLNAHLLSGSGVPLTVLLVFAVLLAVSLLLARWQSRRMPAFRFLPYLTVPVVAWLPLAGALYLVTSTAWTALEHAVWRRPVTTGNGER
jgi:YidC/Oxa1 family membrane protein insertase